MVALPGIAIQSKIYESSNSLVYRGIRDDGLAHCFADTERVIVKLLKQDYPSPQELTRYRQEYEITRSLNVEGVIKAYSQQDYQRTLFILLEDFGGESIERWMRQRPEFFPMSLPEFLQLAIALTNILGGIHAANVIHKDINPGNIVLNPDTGVVKIIDFGIATQFSRTNPTFKSPHGLEGTLAYLSPEQTGRMNRTIDYRTDFYSLGVTFYELLTGHLPFPTTNVLELVHCHIAKQPTPPYEVESVGCGVWGVRTDGSSSTRHTIPKAVSDIVMKLMAKSAEDRYQSAWGIKADLERCVHQLEEIGRIDCFQLGLQDMPEQFQIPQKLYGREAELEALLTAFEQVAENQEWETSSEKPYPTSHTPHSNLPTPHTPYPTLQTSTMMLVTGYAGIGKSALVQELYKPITAKRGYFTSGKFDQLQRNLPYSAIVQALQKLVRQLLSEPEEQVQQWRSRLLAALKSNGQIIIDVIPEVELIIGKQPPVSDVGATEAQNRFNLTFQSFVRVFCSKQHPLVIFLDDLQWADSATLKLIELLLLDEQTQSLFLIGAYRDNEVTLTHPLAIALEKLKQSKAAIHQISLTPLAAESVSQLIAQTLLCDLSTARPLAELVWRKTGGNPFFVNEFLRTLNSEELVTFNVDHRCWQWDVAQIESKGITDNVVELTIGKLRQLSEPTQNALCLAACVGAEFDLNTLSIICKRSPTDIFAELATAIETGLVLPTSELDENLLVQHYKFLHDRVQQAAYTLIDESQKPVVHLEIGRNLLQMAASKPVTNLAASETFANQVFKVVDHLNLGAMLVTEQPKRDEIARLNLIAGQKARTATAYEAAVKYFNIGRSLLAFDSWQTNYELSLTLYESAVEATYLCGDFMAMEQLACVVHNHAKTVFDEVKVYDVKIQAAASQGNLKQAIKIGLMVLARLGVELTEEPSQLDIQTALEKTAAQLADREIADLINLRAMSQPEPLAAMRILSSITSLAFIAAPNLFPLISLAEVNLSIAYGNNTLSAHGYVVYGIVLCGIVQEIEAGYQFGKLALSLAEQLDIKEVKAKISTTFAASVMHWKEHLKETLPIWLEGYQSAMETGSFEYVGYCGFHIPEHLYFIGRELTGLEQEIATYSQIVSQVRRESPLNWLAILWQSVLNLLGHSKNPGNLMGDVYNEERSLPQAIEANDISELVFCYLNKLILDYLFGNYSQAIKNAMLAEQYLSGIPGRVAVGICHFYDSLAHLARFAEASNVEQETWLIRVNASQEKMRIWAYHAPQNYQHKYDLVEAEKARVLGQFFEAEERYEQAIQGARDNEYIQEEALAYELAAKFYLVRGREKFAQLYMKEAHYCYERWGATAKVKDLETCYPQFFAQPSDAVHTSIRTPSNTISSHLPTVFDLAAVLKASQAISSEIELEQLLRSLMQILVENAGAQTGCLILEDSGKWTIEAACELNEGEQICETQVLQSIPIANRLPESIIQYVIRTHESVILNDATREGNFIHESYLQHNQTHSLLCLPLLNQNKLVGVLYLENQLVSGAFTRERSQVLNLLSTQAAIAIENAKLYSKLRASESQMTQFLEAIPLGITVVDTAGCPYYLNQRAAQLTGKEVIPSTTLDQLTETYQIYVAGTDQKYPTEKLTLFRALRGERASSDDSEIHRDGTIIPVEIWSTPVFGEQGNVAYAIAAFQDITERKQAEKLLAEYNQTLEQQVTERTVLLSQEIEERQQVENALRQSEEQRRLTLDFSYIGSWNWNIVENTTEWNDNHARLLGLVPGEVESSYQVWRDRVHPEDIERVEQAVAIALATHTDFEAEYRVIYPDNTVHWLVGRGRGIYNEARQPVRMLGVILDISDRKLAEAASILEERNRMAREIHDTLAQSFTGILLQVGAATRMTVDMPESTQIYFEMIDELARIGLAEARRSVAALRPQLLEAGNLDSALHRLVTQMKATINTVLTYETQGTAHSLPADVENNLLRIGQEALTNAIKHACAREIRVELVYNQTQCILRVRDDGRGFGVGSTPVSGGFGLLGMSERAERIGAQLSIQSRPGQGTEIVVVVGV
jgi:PAS domain S-box-containing protein